VCRIVDERPERDRRLDARNEAEYILPIKRLTQQFDGHHRRQELVRFVHVTFTFHVRAEHVLEHAPRHPYERILERDLVVETRSIVFVDDDFVCQNLLVLVQQPLFRRQNYDIVEQAGITRMERQR